MYFRPAFDFLAIKLTARGDSSALADLLRFCAKVKDMADMAEVYPSAVQTLFNSFVSILQEGCSDEPAVSKLLDINAQMKELVENLAEKRRTLYAEEEKTEDAQRKEAIEAEVRKLNSECFSKLDALIDEAVEVVESLDPASLHHPAPRKQKQAPREQVEWNAEWENNWKLELAQPVCDYIQWAILDQLSARAPSPSRYEEKARRTEEAIASAVSPEDLLSVVWWSSMGFPTPEIAMTLARKFDSALSSGVALSADELVAVSCVSSDAFSRLNDEQVAEMYPMLKRFLETAIRNEPLWALPRLAKITLQASYLKRTAFRRRSGFSGGELAYAQIPDDAVYDLLWEIRQMSKARDYRVLLAPPWLGRVGSVKEIPEPLSWPILYQFQLVRVSGSGIVDATDLISDRLMRKKDWKGLADLLKWHASLLNFSPELAGVHSGVLQGFSGIANDLKKERALWLRLDEFEALAERAQSIAQEISSHKGLPELAKMKSEERMELMEKWEAEKYGQIRETILRSAELLALEE